MESLLSGEVFDGKGRKERRQEADEEEKQQEEGQGKALRA